MASDRSTDTGGSILSEAVGLFPSVTAGAGNCVNNLVARLVGRVKFLKFVVGNKKSNAPWRLRLRRCSNALEKNSRFLRIGPPTWNPGCHSLAGGRGSP